VNRGGDVTYHGPGQLVGYPIVDLRGDLPGKRGPHLGPVDYVRLLEEVLIQSCGNFRVMTERVKGATGVWTVPNGSVPAKKIAAIGVHVSCGITSHGFALNVTTDLRDFGWIVPCGIADKGVTSLELESPLDPPPAMQDAIHAVSRNFGRIFNRQMVWVESVDALFPGAHGPVQ
jgi:lipoyl(octanoyl) transferase